MTRFAIGVLALILALSGCGSAGRNGKSVPQLVPESALDGLLLSADELNTVMSTSGMTPHPTVRVMGDHRNLLPNLNCLGVWQVDEAAIYGDGWIGMRQQMMRSPDNDDWDNLVVQSVVTYPSPQAARDFFGQSSERWSKCTDHHVNITLNGQRMPEWKSGELTKTDNELAIPYTRGSGDQIRSCQHALSVTTNLVIDVQACKPPKSTVTQASDIAHTIASSLDK